MTREYYITHLKSQRAYARSWYKANRMYKKTYRRLYSRLIQASDPQKMGDLSGALDAIISDRARQVKKGRWLDERTGAVYTGIRPRKTV